MASPIGPDTLNVLAHSLRMCHRNIGALQQKCYAEAGVDCTLYEATVLTFLLQNGTSDQQALAAYCDVDKAGITRVLKQMEQRQLVNRNRNRDDLRQKHVELTAQGRSLARKVQRCDEQALERAFGTLPKVQLVQLDETLGQLQQYTAMR